MRASLKNRTLGVAFIGLLVLGVWLVNAIFNQKFTHYDDVTLKADHIGLQLPDRADVKVRGEIVGEVTNTRVSPKQAILTLGIDPDKIGSIPSNVSASILPKTLFGEKYVSLVIPKSPSSKPLYAGKVISQTKLPIEVEKVLDDIYPLLRTVQPAEINYTLNALATALEGRGDAIGKNLQVLNSYLVRMHPKVPKLISDVKLLGKVSNTYAGVMPDIAATLRNTVKTGNTLLEKQKTLNSFLQDTASFSDTARGFLNTNGDNIVRLGRLTEPQVKLLARYSPEFPCMLKALNTLGTKLASTFRGFVFHINVQTLPKQPRGYNTGDLPVYGAKLGPYCGTMPNVPYSPKHFKKSIPDFNDGVKGQLNRTSTGFDATAVTGTAQEKAVVVPLTAPVLGVPADRVSDITTLLFGPLARGSEVSMR